MQIEIETETSGAMLLFDLMESDPPVSPGYTKEVPGGATITYKDMRSQRSAGAGDTIILIIQFAGQAISTVALNLVSSWLWEKLTKHKVKKTQIDGLDVRFNDKGEFQRILAKKITIEESAE